MMSHGAALAAHFVELPASRRRRRCGVYVLLLDDQVIYVGSSTDADTRIGNHIDGNNCGTSAKVFDRVMFIALPAKVLKVYEGALIRAFCPTHNGAVPVDRDGHDAEILEGLGLDKLAVDAATMDEWRKRVNARRLGPNPFGRGSGRARKVGRRATRSAA